MDFTAFPIEFIVDLHGEAIDEPVAWW